MTNNDQNNEALEALRVLRPIIAYLASTEEGDIDFDRVLGSAIIPANELIKEILSQADKQALKAQAKSEGVGVMEVAKIRVGNHEKAVDDLRELNDNLEKLTESVGYEFKTLKQAREHFLRCAELACKIERCLTMISLSYSNDKMSIIHGEAHIKAKILNDLIETSLTEQREATWQPIDTAPDDELLLVWVEADDGSWGEYAVQDKTSGILEDSLGFRQTKWMHLPTAPTNGENN